MKRHKFQRFQGFFIVALVGLFSAWVSAQQLPDPHKKITKANSLVILQNADTISVRQIIELQALTPEGAQALTKAQIGFNSALQKLEIVQAKTIKADGREILVRANDMAVQKGYSAPGVGVTLPEWEIREINYPDLKSGDRVFRELIYTSLKPQLPGYQTYQDYMLPQIGIDEMTVRIEAPKNLSISVSASPSLSLSVEGEKQVWTGKASHVASTLDNNASSIRGRIGHVMLSTLPSHEELGKRFAKAMIDKAVVTPELETLAKRITVFAKNDEEKARAIYDWVRKEIKYVALFLGVGGWVPHDTAHVLEKRYGDCKDHVTLMLAMLKAVGVESRPALINTNAHYELDPVAIGFNHVISYIPSLNKFLDPTAMNTPYEALPYVDYGKPVVVSNGSEAEILRTPVLTAANNWVVVGSRYLIKADGSAELALKVNSQGHAATALQNQLMQIQAGMESVAVQRTLQQSRYSGTGSMRYEKVNRDLQTQSFESDMTIRDLLRSPESGAVAVNPQLALPIYVLNNMGNYQQEARTMPYVCNSMRMREEFSMAFEPGFKLSRAPEAFKREIQGIRFEAQYELKGTTLEGSRELVIDHPSQECSVAEYQRRRMTMMQIARHLRAQVIYER